MTFEQIVVESDYVQFNNTKFFVSAPNNTTITLVFLHPNPDICEDVLLLKFIASASGGNVTFNISSFKEKKLYVVKIDGNPSIYTTNDTGFLSFYIDSWSEHTVEIYRYPCYFIYSPQNPTNGQQVLFIDKSAYSTHTKWFINNKLIAEAIYSSGSHTPFNLSYTFNISNIYNVTLWVYNETFNISDSYTVNLHVDRNLTLEISPNHVGINYISYHFNTTINASKLMDILDLHKGEWIHKFNESTNKWMSLWKYTDTVKLGDNFKIYPWDVVVVVVGSGRTLRINITEKVNTTQTKALSKGYHYLSWSNETKILSCDMNKIGLQNGDWVFKYDLQNETWLSYNVGLSGDIFEIKSYDCIVVNLADERNITIGE